MIVSSFLDLQINSVFLGHIWRFVMWECPYCNLATPIYECSKHSYMGSKHSYIRVKQKRQRQFVHTPSWTHTHAWVKSEWVVDDAIEWDSAVGVSSLPPPVTRERNEDASSLAATDAKNHSRPITAQPHTAPSSLINYRTSKPSTEHRLRWIGQAEGLYLLYFVKNGRSAS